VDAPPELQATRHLEFGDYKDDAQNLVAAFIRGIDRDKGGKS
jgi:hypothetical protein